MAKFEYKDVAESVDRKDISNVIDRWCKTDDNNKDGWLSKIEIVKNKDRTFDVFRTRTIFLTT
jgi:hypothetical protein